MRRGPRVLGIVGRNAAIIIPRDGHRADGGLGGMDDLGPGQRSRTDGKRGREDGRKGKGLKNRRLLGEGGQLWNHRGA